MRPPRILIADDDTALASLISERLEQHGYATVTAASGYEALVIAVSEHPDLLLLDVNMPMGNGFDTHSRLCKINPEGQPQVIYISGEPAPWLPKAAIDRGAGFIRKPIDMQLLLETVDRTLNRVRHQAG